MSFKVVTDSTCNLPVNIIEREDITIVPFYFYPADNSEEQMVCLDIENFNAKEYYDSIRNGKMYNTSQVVPQNYYDVISKLTEEGHDIIILTMSSGISGTFNSSMIAKSMLEEDYPERKIFCVDTLGAGGGQGLLTMKAAEYSRQGLTAEEAYDKLLIDVKKLYQLFTVDDLKHLHRTGRLSNVAALVGSVLQVKPLLIGNENGKIVSTEKMRGFGKAIRAMAEKYNSLAVDPTEQTVIIANADNVDGMENLVKLISETNPPKELIKVSFDPATGSHVGPGSLAIFFMGNEDVRKQQGPLTAIASKVQNAAETIPGKLEQLPFYKGKDKQ
ncbi:MAG: DegV family protein [Lachnospiraceae bacterium]|nr:DegV family protein [Lachnospiraceae bacterium]